MVCDVDSASAHLGGTEGNGQLSAVFEVGGGSWRGHDGQVEVEKRADVWAWVSSNRRLGRLGKDPGGSSSAG